MLRWSVVAAVGWAVAAMAVVPTTGTTPSYTQITVNNASGSSFDPHVSGDIAAYTHNDFDGTGTSIHYYRFSTATDATISRAANEQDFLSDTDGNSVVYSHVDSRGTSIRVFDTATSTPTEIDADPTPNRFSGSLGGGQLAYIDMNAGVNGELIIHDMALGTRQQITFDTATDQNPNMSPDGSTVVWEHCELDTNHCDVWQAVRSGSTWTVSIASADPAQEDFPDTNGSLITYASDRPSGAGDIYYRAVGGSVETEVELPAIQAAPNLAGKYIAFASNQGGNYDVYLYDVTTNTLYQVTTTSFDELLDDATILPDGSVRLIWENTELSASRTHVYAATISFPVAGGTGGGAGGGAGGGGGSTAGGTGGSGGGGGDDCEDDDDGDHGDGDGHGDDGNGCSWGGHGWHHNGGGWHFHHVGHENHGWGHTHHGDGDGHGRCDPHRGNGHHWTGSNHQDGDHSEHHDDLSASTDNGARGCSGTGGAPWLVLVALVLIALGSRKPQAQPARIKK